MVAMVSPSEGQLGYQEQPRTYQASSRSSVSIGTLCASKKGWAQANTWGPEMDSSWSVASTSASGEYAEIRRMYSMRSIAGGPTVYTRRTLKARITRE